MKKIWFALSIFLILNACNTARNTQSVNNSFIPGTQELSEVESKVLNELLSYASLQTKSSSSDSPTMRSITEVVTSDWCTIEYYKMDLAKFYADPKPENIEKCLDKQERQMLFIGKTKNKGYTMLTGSEFDDGWQPSSVSTDDADDYVKWVGNVSEGTNTKGFRVVEIFGRSYYLVKSDGVFQIYDAAGKLQPFDQFWRYIKLRYEKSLEVKNLDDIIVG